MERETITIILLLLWMAVNAYWTLSIKRREGWCNGALDAMQEMCHSLAKALGIEPGETPVSEIISEEQKPEESGEYCGVLHVFKRHNKKLERPVLMYIYQNKKCFYEYDETGKKLFLNSKDYKDAILRTMEGENTMNFKKYEIESK